MRDLFAEEMTAQRELHERVAQVHLDDFKEQFHTSTISTISFAVAMLPLQAPPTRRHRGGCRRSRRTPAIPPRPRPSTAPTDRCRSSRRRRRRRDSERKTLGLADGTGSSRI